MYRSHPAAPKMVQFCFQQKVSNMIFSAVETLQRWIELRQDEKFFEKSFYKCLVVLFRSMYLCVAFSKSPVRLGVRTQDFHSCNTGSIPVRGTKKAAIWQPFLFAASRCCSFRSFLSLTQKFSTILRRLQDFIALLLNSDIRKLFYRR